MTKREKQYINWKNFWRKRKNMPVVITKTEYGYSATIHSGRIRVPDSILKKMKIA